MNLSFGRLTRLVAGSSLESDGALLAAYLGGSQPAFRQLVDRHGPLVFGVCLRVLRHRQDAEDAFQAVFLVLARRAGDLWPQDAVGSWLYGVACRIALKARARRSRTHGREQPLEDVAAALEPGPEPDVAEVVARAVCKLPEVYRAAVVACELQGLSRKDAARQLNWSEGTLSSRLARAKRLLANRLLKTGVALPAAGLATVFGQVPPVRAALPETVMLVTTATGGAPARVVALTQGVVTNVFAFKLKQLIAATLMMSTLGFGAYCAGAGDEPGTQPKQGQTSPAAAKAPDGPNTARKQGENTSNAKPNERVITLPVGSAPELAAKLAQMMAEMKKNPVEIVGPVRPANSDVVRMKGFQLMNASAQIVAARLQTVLSSRFPGPGLSTSPFRVVFDTASNIVWVSSGRADVLDLAADLMAEWDAIEPQAIGNAAEKPKKPVKIEVRGNQLVITSDDPEVLDLLARLASLLTSPGPDENLFKVIPLKIVSAEDAAKMLTEIFNGPQQNPSQQGGDGPLVLPSFKGGVRPISIPTAARIRVVADRNSNSIVVIKASPIDLLAIEKLLKDFIDRDNTKGPVPPDERPGQPGTFEVRIRFIIQADGKQPEVGFSPDSYHPDFNGRSGPRGKTLTDDVEILIDGKRGRITDLLPGDTVTVQLSPDKKSVTRIELNPRARLKALESEAEKLRERIRSLEKGK